MGWGLLGDGGPSLFVVGDNMLTIVPREAADRVLASMPGQRGPRPDGLLVEVAH